MSDNDINGWSVEDGVDADGRKNKLAVTLRKNGYYVQTTGEAGMSPELLVAKALERTIDIDERVKAGLLPVKKEG